MGKELPLVPTNTKREWKLGSTYLENTYGWERATFGPRRYIERMEITVGKELPLVVVDTKSEGPRKTTREDEWEPIKISSEMAVIPNNPLNTHKSGAFKPTGG